MLRVPAFFQFSIGHLFDILESGKKKLLFWKWKKAGTLSIFHDELQKYSYHCAMRIQEI